MSNKHFLKLTLQNSPQPLAHAWSIGSFVLFLFSEYFKAADWTKNSKNGDEKLIFIMSSGSGIVRAVAIGVGVSLGIVFVVNHFSHPPEETGPYVEYAADTPTESKDVHLQEVEYAADAPTESNDVPLQEVIDIINEGDSPGSALKGLKKLINLCLNSSSENTLKFTQMGGIGGVVRLLDKYKTDASIQEKAFKLIVNMSADSEKASREMVNQGIVKIIVEALVEHESESIGHVQVKGLWALKNLSHHSEGAQEVQSCGGIELAVKHIKDRVTFGNIVDHSLGILLNISHHHGSAPVMYHTNYFCFLFFLGTIMFTLICLCFAHHSGQVGMERVRHLERGVENNTRLQISDGI